MDFDFDLYMAERRIDGLLAQQLSSLAGADREVVTEVIAETMPSANTLRELFRLATEVSFRDKIELHQVFKVDAVRNVLTSDRTNRKEKQRGLRVELERLRYPQRHQINQQLENCVRGLRRYKAVSVQVPEDAEGDSVFFTVRARSVSEVKDAAAKLELLSSDPDCERLFAILDGCVPNGDSSV